MDLVFLIFITKNNIQFIKKVMNENIPKDLPVIQVFS